MEAVRKDGLFYFHSPRLVRDSVKAKILKIDNGIININSAVGLSGN
jgi:hypothetical protein